MISAIELGQALQAKVELIWEPQDGCRAEFNELFEPVRSEGIVMSVSTENKKWIPSAELPGLKLEKLLQRHGTVYVNAYSAFGFGLLPQDVFIERLRSRLRTLTPVAEVRRYLAIAAGHRFGMHARLSDHLACRATAPCWCYQTVVDMIRERYPRETLFIASDIPAFSKHLSSRAPNQVRHLPPPFANAKDNRNSLAGLRIALADLLQLAASRCLIVSPHSTFSFSALLLSRARPFFAFYLEPGVDRHIGDLARRVRSRVKYVEEADTWEIANPASIGAERLANLASLGIARAFCSALYQERPLNFFRSEFRRRFELYLCALEGLEVTKPPVI